MTATAIGTYATRANVQARIGGTFSAAEDTLIDNICNQVNALVEGPLGCDRILAPVSSATYLFDGDDTDTIWVRDGVRAITLLEIAPYTGGTFVTITAGDYFIRPTAHEGTPVLAGSRIVLSDVPTGPFYTTFPRGIANVRSTMTTGPAAMPDDVVETATATGVQAWHARQLGNGESSGMDDSGNWVYRLLSPQGRATLRAYRVPRSYVA